MEVVEFEKPVMKPIPDNMRAAIGWLLYKFSSEPNCEHLKSLALYVAEELGKALPPEQEEMDKLITSYLEEVGVGQ